jgi:hypothetical protein
MKGDSFWDRHGWKIALVAALLLIVFISTRIANPAT